MAPITVQHHGHSLRIFETEENYLRNNRVQGYWGAVEASIDWCEHNYVVSFFVAEWWNTLSNIVMVVLGLWAMVMAWRAGLDPRFWLGQGACALIGFGSFAFHVSLTHIGQQGDETPMVFGTSIWLYALVFADPAFEARHQTLRPACVCILVVGNCAFAYLHYIYRFVLFFQGLIASSLFSSLFLIHKQWLRCTDPDALWVGKYIYVAAGAFAFFAWLLDQTLCNSLHDLPAGLPNPQLHAWWHMGMGVHLYCGPTFLGYMRLCYLGAKPKIRYAIGVLPYVDPQRGRVE